MRRRQVLTAGGTLAALRGAGLLAVVALPAVAATALPPPWLPLDPGGAQCRATAGSAELANAAVRFAVAVREGHLHPLALDNGFTHRSHALEGELYALTPREGDAVPARRFALAQAPRCAPLAARPEAARAAERRAGFVLEAELFDAATDLKVHWRALLRDGTNYVREEFTLAAGAGLDVAAVAAIDLKLPGATVAGTAPGSPLVADDAFYGFEHPLAEARVVGGHATMRLRRALPLRPGIPVSYSAVLGVTPEGQLRRGFAAYLENERATPFHTFLHYNSWYDIGYFTPYTEGEALAVVHAYGERLVHQRGVRMDSFLFDDGWDDHAHLWQFSRDFPQGFGPLAAATRELGAGPGIWLSPWGGYGRPRQERLAAARAAGYEIDEQGLALSGPQYYARFRDVSLTLLREYGINQFKLDGTGSPDKVTPGSEFDSDFAAAIALITDLRAVKPDLFINLTTGTWPSPFWLRSADSIWRGGEDHGFCGSGSDRQRWITYRDADTYGGIVRQGPLFPLNSLMLHGIIYARHAQGLETDPHDDFADEVHSYFATGTGLQELYVSPDLLTERNLDTLATAAIWARAHGSVLRDSHWIGGDPARDEVYGWASWAPGRAVVALRNPAPRTQSFGFVLSDALELPSGEASVWRGRPAFGTGTSRVLRADVRTHVELAPYQVVVLEWEPEPPAAVARR